MRRTQVAAVVGAIFAVGVLPLILPCLLFDSGSLSYGQVATKENLDLPFNAAGDGEDGDEEAPAVVLFYGQQYEASALVFALDESGSMSDQWRWTIQTREVIRTISELSDQAEFGVVYYGSRVTAFRNTPVPATAGNKAAAIAFINSRRPNGDTCLGEGAVKALQIVAQSTSKHRSVIVTSDGRPDNCATGNRATPAEVLGIYQRTLNANPGRNIKLHTIWVGAVTESDGIQFMKTLAEIHGGSFRTATR